MENIIELKETIDKIEKALKSAKRKKEAFDSLAKAIAKHPKLVEYKKTKW